MKVLTLGGGVEWSLLWVVGIVFLVGMFVKLNFGLLLGVILLVGRSLVGNVVGGCWVGIVVGVLWAGIVVELVGVDGDLLL